MNYDETGARKLEKQEEKWSQFMSHSSKRFFFFLNLQKD